MVANGEPGSYIDMFLFQYMYAIYCRMKCIYTRDYTLSPAGWGGVGLMTYVAHEYIFDATEMMTFLAHEHIFERSQSFDQSFYTHMQILERSFECTACENFAGACKQKRQFSEAIQMQVFRGRW